MGVVGGDEYTERLILLATGPNELLGLLEELVVRAAAEIFEGIGSLRADMCFSCEGHAIAERLEVLGQALGSRNGEGVIKKSLGAPGGASAVEFLSEWRAHGDGSVGLVEFYAVRRQLVYVWGWAIDISIATQAVPVYVVTKQENEVRSVCIQKMQQTCKENYRQ